MFSSPSPSIGGTARDEKRSWATPCRLNRSVKIPSRFFPHDRMAAHVRSWQKPATWRSASNDLFSQKCCLSTLDSAKQIRANSDSAFGHKFGPLA